MPRLILQVSPLPHTSLRPQPDQTSFSSSSPLCSLSPLGHLTCCSICLEHPLPSQSSSYSSFSSQLTRHFLWEALRDLPGWDECLSCVPTVPCSSPITELTTLGRKFLVTGSLALPLWSLRAGMVSYFVFCSTSLLCPYWHMADIQ